jgi:hypothetical protein
MGNKNYIDIVKDYFSGVRTQDEIISYFQASRTVHEGANQIASINHAALSDEEADTVIRSALVLLLKQQDLTPETANYKGYEWVKDSVFPSEAPHEVLLSFLEDLKRDNLVVGQAVGSYPEEVIGLYTMTRSAK